MDLIRNLNEQSSTNIEVAETPICTPDLTHHESDVLQKADPDVDLPSRSPTLLNNPSMPVSRMNKKFARSAITSVIF